MSATDVLAALISQINNGSFDMPAQRPGHYLTTAALRNSKAGKLNWPEWLAPKNQSASNQPCLQIPSQEQK
jgi:hypothetical protein